MKVLRAILIGTAAMLACPAIAADRVALPELPGAPPYTLDPHRAVTTSEQILSTALFQGLVRRDTSGALAPGLAEHWTVSPSGLEYQFHLRRDLKWSDGKRIDAAAVVRSLKRALDPATAAPFVSLLLPIKNAELFRLGTLPSDQQLGVKARNDTTVEIILDRPSHRFLSALAAPVGAVVPAHTWAVPETGVDAFTGNGGFTLIKKTSGYSLKAIGVPAGEVELVADPGLAARSVGFFSSVGDGGRPALYQLLVNVRQAPLNQRDARHALGMVIDRDALLATLKLPNARVAYSVTQEDGALAAPYAKLSVADRKTVAEALLLDVARDKPLRVVLPDQPVHRAIGAALVSAWGELGFKVELQPLASGVYERAVLDGRFDVAWMPPWGFGRDRADRLFLFSQAAGPWNAGGYREPALDQYLASADADPTADGRNIQWRGAEELIVEDQPAWPLFFYSTDAVQIHDVTGWTGLSPQ
jgi:oligopeptide transport system substrate-binding protein